MYIIATSIKVGAAETQYCGYYTEALAVLMHVVIIRVTCFKYRNHQFDESKFFCT